MSQTLTLSNVRSSKDYGLVALELMAPVPAIEEFTITEELLRDKEKFNVNCFGPNFAKMFFGKVASTSPAITSAAHVLRQGVKMDFYSIRNGLGTAAAMSIGQVLNLVCQQSQGKEGLLMVNGRSNFFFVEHEGEVSVVYLRWVPKKQSWHIGDYSLLVVDQWNSDYRFVSKV